MINDDSQESTGSGCSTEAHRTAEKGPARPPDEPARPEAAVTPPPPPPNPEEVFKQEFIPMYKKNFKPGMCDAIIKYVQAKTEQ